ncbi:MAG: NAD-dependent epimerase/dehydratase family protein [Bacteroidales bacterium]
MIFVTGGTGLVGAHILLYLIKDNKKIRALKRKNSKLDLLKDILQNNNIDPKAINTKIEWIEGDLLDPFIINKALEGVDMIYHSAAQISFAPHQENNLNKINVEGTALLVNTALEKNIKKFGYVSSIATLSRGHGITTDEDCWWTNEKNTSLYSVSKHLAEQEVWRASAEGLDVIIVNPSIILGPGNWKTGSTELFHSIYKGLKFYTRGATGFVDVRDVAMAMIQLMDSDISNERFVLNSENIPYKTLFDYIANGFNIKPPSIFVHKWMGSIAWRIAWVAGKLQGKKPLITKETTRSANNTTQYSNSKIKKSLNYNFIPIKQSVEDTCLILKKRFID